MKNKICVLFLMSCLIICTLVGCGTNSTKTEELNMVDTIWEELEKTNISDKGGNEEDLSGVVPLSKKINKGKMIAFGCMGGLHDAYVYKIFFFDCGKVTVVSNLEPIGEYGGFMLESLEELLNKSEEELWELCDDFKKYQIRVSFIYPHERWKVLKTGGAGFHREIQSFSTGSVGKVVFFGQRILSVHSDVVLDIFMRL